MANQRELDLLVKITTQGTEALSQIQQQLTAIASTPFTFGGAIDSIRQLAAEFQKLNQSAEQNAAAKEGAKVAAESAKAAQQLAKARSEEEKANQQAQKVETERLKTQKEALLLDQQTLKNETEKARAIKETANAESASERAQQAAIRTERLKNQPEKKEGGEGLFGSITGAIPEIALVSAAFNQVTESIGKVGEFGKQVFEGLIAQVVEIRGQTLGIASVVAATQSIIVDGKKIDNPLDAIQATLPEVQRGIEQLKRDSTETVLTTSQLIPVYQTVAGQISNLGINLDQAEKLSVRLSQAASGINLPYQQAQQEINGIVRGEINQYNQLARSLGISQTYYTQLVAQGRIYDVLIDRTKALAQGQKLAADQLPGVLSTIKDSFELITQQAGGPLLDALLKPVIAFREFFKANQQNFEGFAKGISTAFVGIVDGIATPLITHLQPAFAALGNAFAAVSQLFSDFSQNQAPILGEYFGKLANLAGAVLNAAIVATVGVFTNLVEIFDVIISNPIIQFISGTVASALGAVVDTVTAVVNAFSSFNSASTNAFGSLFDGLSAVEKQVGTALKPLGTAFQEIQLIVGAVFGGIGSKIQSAFAPVLPVLRVIGGAIVSGLVAPIKYVGDAFNGLFGFVGQVTAKIREIVGGIIDNPAFKVFAKIVGVNIEEVRAGLKKLNEDAAGDGLKKAGEGAEKAGKDFKTANLALDDLGKTSDLIKVQLAGAFRDLGNRDKAEDAAKRIITLTQQALENGTISRAEAERNLKALQNNTGLQLDTRLNAEKAATKIIQDGGKERLDAIKTREAEVQNAVKAGQLSQIEGDRQLTELKKEELDKQIEITQKALEREQSEGRGLGPRATELRNQLQQQQAERTAITEDGNRKRAQAELTGADNQLKILEGKRVSGKLSEEAFANESLAITRKRIDSELKELERERALLKPGDTAGQQDIDAKEAALNGKREAAEEQFQARKLAIVERAQKKAEDTAKLSEISRNTEVDKLLAARQIREVEAGLLRVQSSRATIAKELELEKEKTAALERLPKLVDPVKEEERQVKIRASRIKTAELADSLVKNEIEAQQALFRVVSERLDRQAQAAKNASEAQVQPLQAQLQLQDALSKSLDNQNKLLESRKGLQSALSGYLEGELGILAKSAKSDDEKQKIAQLSAAAKFKALQQQQAIEQQSLEIQIKQNEAALAREKIQNRISKLQNAADVAQAQADLAKAKAKPDATPEEINAAKLNLEAKQLAGKGLDLQGELLQQQGQVNEVSAQNQRQVLALKQQGELDQGKQGLIDTLPEGAKQQAQQNLTQEILQRLGLGNAIGDTNTDLITNATLQQRGVGNFGLPGQFNPVAPSIPALANNPALTKLLGEFDQLADGKGSGKKESQASDLETALKQQQATETQQRERQGDRALSQQQTEAEKQRQGVIKSLEQKRTQLVLLQGEQGEALLAIEESLASGDGAGATSGTVKGRVAGQSQKELLQGVLAQFQDGAIPKSKDLDGVLDAFRKSTERKIVATLPANPFKEAETALKDSISEDEKQGRGKSDATADKREALDKLEKLRTQLVLLQGDQGKAILSLAGSSQQTAGATSKTAEKIDEVVKNTAEKVKVGLPLTSTQPSKNVPNNVVDDLKRNIRTYYNSLFNLNASQGGAIVPSLVPPPKAIAPLTGNGGNPQMLATLEKINKAIEGNQLRPVHATVHNSIAGPDAATVVDLATKRMTDKLIGVLEKA